jgi:hypothetical protein
MPDNGRWSLYGAPWLQPVATARKLDPLGNGDNNPKPLPSVATRCREERMVRRGSTVRVRQRALQKPRTWALLRSARLQGRQRAVGVEPFMELSGREGRSEKDEIGAAARSLSSCIRRSRSALSDDAEVRRRLRDWPVGGLRVRRRQAEDFREYGQPVERSWRLAVATVGQVQWELIEPAGREALTPGTPPRTQL